MTRSPLYDDSLLFSAPLHSRARAPPSVFLPLVLGGRQYGEPAGRGNPFVSPRPLPHHGDGAGPPLFATDSSYCKSEMSLIWIFGFYFDCMATILHGPRHNRCHTFPVRIIIDPCVDSSFLCYSLQWRILRWVCLLLLIALTTLLFTSLCQGLQVMCISFLQVMRYAQFWSNDSFLHSKASTLFFFFFFPDDSVFNAKASSFISCRYHSQWTDAAFKFAMHLYLFFSVFISTFMLLNFFFYRIFRARQTWSPQHKVLMKCRVNNQIQCPLMLQQEPLVPCQQLIMTIKRSAVKTLNL
jgi:hypothetical protein